MTRVQLAMALIIVGLILEALCVTYTVPGTFLGFLFLGVPCVVAGVGLLANCFWRHRKQRGVVNDT